MTYPHPKAFAKSTNPSLGSMRLPAQTEIAVADVRCVVSTDLTGYDPPGDRKAIALVIAKVGLRIDGRYVVACDDRGNLLSDPDVVTAVSTLAFNFMLTDPAGGALPTKQDSGVTKYQTNIGWVRLDTVAGAPHVAILTQEPAEQGDIIKVAWSPIPNLPESTEGYEVRLKGAEDLFCCREEETLRDVRFKAEVEIDEAKAKRLLCPCPEEEQHDRSELCAYRHPAVRVWMESVFSLSMDASAASALNTKFFLLSGGRSECRALSTELQRALDPATVMRRASNAVVNRRYRGCSHTDDAQNVKVERVNVSKELFAKVQSQLIRDIRTDFVSAMDWPSDGICDETVMGVYEAIERLKETFVAAVETVTYEACTGAHAQLAKAKKV